MKQTAKRILWMSALFLIFFASGCKKELYENQPIEFSNLNKKLILKNVTTWIETQQNKHAEASSFIDTLKKFYPCFVK